MLGYSLPCWILYWVKNIDGNFASNFRIVPRERENSKAMGNNFSVATFDFGVYNAIYSCRCGQICVARAEELISWIGIRWPVKRICVCVGELDDIMSIK